MHTDQSTIHNESHGHKYHFFLNTVFREVFLSKFTPFEFHFFSTSTFVNDIIFFFNI
jgi:hypothetical protein